MKMAYFITYVVNEGQGAIRVTLPDFRINTLAHAICDVPAQVQKLLEEQYRGPVPKDSYIEDWQDDASYRGGWWLWLNLDVDGLTDRGRRRRKLTPVPAQDAAS
jgi:hypothetical protein